MSAVKKPRMIANESNIKGKIRQKDLSSGLNSISHKRQSLRNCASPLREGENEDEEDWDELNKWDIDESFAAPIPTKLKVKQQNKSAPDKQKQQQQLKTEKKKASALDVRQEVKKEVERVRNPDANLFEPARDVDTNPKNR